MFVDASAIIAILTGEPDAESLVDRLEAAKAPMTSPVAIFEAVAGICHAYHVSVEEARQDVADFMAAAGIRVVSISADDGDTALLAFARYGKGRGHPAQLNMSDCFAYAIARNNSVALLFTGDEFSRTDIVLTR